MGFVDHHRLAFTSWSDRGAVSFPDLGPVVIVFGQGIFTGQLFVDVYAKSGRFIDKEIAIFNPGSSREYFMDQFIELLPLLDAKIPDGQINVCVCRPFAY